MPALFFVTHDLYLWLQNKWVSRTHLGTFLCQVCIRFWDILRKTDRKQVRTLLLRLLWAWTITVLQSSKYQQSQSNFSFTSSPLCIHWDQ